MPSRIRSSFPRLRASSDLSDAITDVLPCQSFLCRGSAVKDWTPRTIAKRIQRKNRAFQVTASIDLFKCLPGLPIRKKAQELGLVEDPVISQPVDTRGEMLPNVSRIEAKACETILYIPIGERLCLLLSISTG